MGLEQQPSQSFTMNVPTRSLRPSAGPERAGNIEKGGLEKSEPNPIDIHVGHRLRARRTLLGLSQEKVGEAMGLTFQQVQKYERGANRIGASRLWDMSRILNCPISYFFDEIDAQTDGASPRNTKGNGQALSNDDDPLIQRETLELVRAYYAINNYQVRRRIYDLARSLAAQDGEVKLPNLADEAVSA
jgi:transcriptional regulator with XRE-family HTH domain